MARYVSLRYSKFFESPWSEDHDTVSNFRKMILKDSHDITWAVLYNVNTGRLVERYDRPKITRQRGRAPSDERAT
jgi:hypothetical protein